jgi:predicted transcriptional regulator
MKEIRAEMHAMSEQLDEMAARLAHLAEATKRRYFGRRPDVSDEVTDEVRTALFEAWYEDPEVTQHELARQFNLNPGRVSETLNGFRR